MAAVPKTKLTVAQYLAIERAAEIRSEFYRGEMFTVTRTTREHNAIKESLIGRMGIQFKGGPCYSLSSTQRVKVSAIGLSTYPDILIVCGKAEYDLEDRDALLNPQVIFEILSDSTEKDDRGKKFEHYQQIPAAREYILVCQDQMRVERFVRQPNNSWLLTVFIDPASEFALTTVPAHMPLRRHLRWHRTTVAAGQSDVREPAFFFAIRSYACDGV